MRTRNGCTVCSTGDDSVGNGSKVKVAKEDRTVREKRMPAAATVMVEEEEDQEAASKQYCTLWMFDRRQILVSEYGMACASQ